MSSGVTVTTDKHIKKSMPIEKDWRPQSYVVQKGDTLYGIAFNHGLDYHEIAELNNIQEPYVIRENQELRLFAAGTAVEKPKAVEVKPIAIPVKTQPRVVMLPYSEMALVEIQKIQDGLHIKPETVAVAKVECKPEAKLLVKHEVKVEALPELKPEVKPSTKREAKDVRLDIRSEVKPSAKREAKDVKLDIRSEVKPEIKPSAKHEIKEVKLEIKSEVKPEVKTESKPEVKHEAKPEIKPETKVDAPSEVVADSPMVDAPIEWGMPTSGKVIGEFSESANRKGVDISGKKGQDVIASAAGKVVYSGSGLRGYGKMIIIKHNNTYLSAYANNDQILVKEGQVVTKGQKIAEMGNTDSADQVKLHFEIRKYGKPVDPSKYLSLGKL